MMDFWQNKIAIITGAGQGIGAQIAEDLIKSGMTVIGFEPTFEKVDKMMEKLEKWDTTKGQLVPCKCDISNTEDLKHAFEGIVEVYGGVDLLINNAAIGKDGLISTGDIKDMINIIDVNIFGLLACTRFAIESMLKKNKSGRIININSICGHYMPPFSKPTINMYIASKKAMTAFTNQIRKELELLKCNIKISSISPGIVRTGIFKSAGVDFINEEFFSKNPHLSVKDVSDIVMMTLSNPNVNVKEIIFHALKELF